MLTANNQGKLKGKIKIPANIPAGTKLVQFYGDKGSYGETTYTGKKTITIEERRRVIAARRVDPLAQTFTLNESRHIGGVELWFINKGKKRVVVQTRETAVGMPSQTVIAESYIEPKDIKVDGTATRITWSPVFCHAGQEYAIVLLTDDADTAVKIAELGKYDAVNSRWVTSQPYQVGVLLSSSNASTWTPHQNLDLTFRLLAAKFSELFHLFNLGKVNANNVSDLIVLTNVEKVAFDTNVEFILTDEEGRENFLSDNLPLALRERLSGELTVKASLKGGQEKSPVLYPGLQLVMGNLSESGDYVTRSITAGSNTKVTITYDALIPGTADVKSYVEQSAKGGEKWQLVNLTSGKPIGENWVERTHVLSNFNGNETRIKLVLSGTVIYRPKVKNLRVIIT
ncbi:MULTISPECIES: hypothetical protein [Wolbachia]|uniref:Uncharacterized protein n=2 Tax=Wolbachia TaxID=953 RepID=A0A6C1U3P0_WOLPI|nr:MULTISPECIES: hypothetical protein [Wolbachia]QBB84236.1 hypothetical protein DEJ70_05895 [Wolbachia pipientis wAlbB]QDW10228.1 hypothetical protein CO538_005870 [Wolbachia pipientis]QZA83303.1 hypothetical protein K1Y75_05735 [Wolbachia pipientis]THA20448.1 hypothetical protein EJE47_00160 [Wolbachia endosymbiont of Aedes albopictus]TVS94184.1 hypothetical protein COM42_004205 [Wolbachia pipientis]